MEPPVGASRTGAIVDAHNDLLLELVHRAAEDNPFSARWLWQLRDGGVELQVCPVSAQFEQLPEGALRQALEQIAAFYRAAGENDADVVVVRSRADLERAEREGTLGLMLSMEGAEPLGSSIDLADIFWRLGVRMFSLTWNRRNAFADGAGEPARAGSRSSAAGSSHGSRGSARSSTWPTPRTRRSPTSSRPSRTGRSSRATPPAGPCSTRRAT
jgi:membrane dipeptidase